MLKRNCRSFPAREEKGLGSLSTREGVCPALTASSMSLCFCSPICNRVLYFYEFFPSFLCENFRLCASERWIQNQIHNFA